MVDFHSRALLAGVRVEASAPPQFSIGRFGIRLKPATERANQLSGADGTGAMSSTACRGDWLRRFDYARACPRPRQSGDLHGLSPTPL